MPTNLPTPTGMTDQNQWIREMLQALARGGGNLPTSGPGYDAFSGQYATAPPPPAAAPPPKVGAGQSEYSRELGQALDMPGSAAAPPSAGPPVLSMDRLGAAAEAGNLSADQMELLQQMIAQALAGTNRYNMGRY